MPVREHAPEGDSSLSGQYIPGIPVPVGIGGGVARHKRTVASERPDPFRVDVHRGACLALLAPGRCRITDQGHPRPPIGGRPAGAVVIHRPALGGHTSS